MGLSSFLLHAVKWFQVLLWNSKNFSDLFAHIGIDIKVM